MNELIKNTKKENSEIGTSLTHYCMYKSLNKETLSLFEEIEFQNLPDTITLDEKIDVFFDLIRQQVEINKQKRKNNPIRLEARRKLRLYLESQTDDESKRHLEDITREEEKIPDDLEHSLVLYKEDGQILKGQYHVGDKNAVSREPNADGLDDEKSIVDIHTHPNTSPQSRGDLGSILVNDQNRPKNCLYMIAAQELDILSVPTSDSIRKPREVLKDELLLRFRQEEEYYAELDKFLELIPDDITNKRQIQFIMWYLDIMSQAEKYKVGIYYRIRGVDKEFKRPSDIQEIIDLSKKLSKY